MVLMWNEVLNSTEVIDKEMYLILYLDLNLLYFSKLFTFNDIKAAFSYA